MSIVLADVEANGLQQTADLARQAEAQRVVTHVCDVSNAEHVQAMADVAFETFGHVNFLFNNAGVAVAGPVWTATLDDWKWTLGVNVMGVVHGIRAFVPRMISGGTEAHIVNTASVAGLLAVPGSAVYCASKHAVVAISECLQHELSIANARIGVSVLCPAWVRTGIADSERARPAQFAERNPLGRQAQERMRKAVDASKLDAAAVASMTLEAIRADQFYILTHPAIEPAIAERTQRLLERRPPKNPMP